MTVVSVVLGEPSERARDADSLALLRYGLDSYDAATALPEGRVLGKVALRYRGGESVDVVAGATVRRVLRRGARTSVTVIGLPTEVDGPLPRGTRLGTAIVRARRRGARARAGRDRAAGRRGRPRRRAWTTSLGRSQTIVALVLLLACSLPLLLLRRRAMRRRRALDAEHRRARRREEITGRR